MRRFSLMARIRSAWSSGLRGSSVYRAWSTSHPICGFGGRFGMPPVYHDSGSYDESTVTTPWDVGYKARWQPPAPRRMDVLWRLVKDKRVAEARVSPHPLGVELYFFVNDGLLWSQVFRDGDGALSELADGKREEFEALGWRRC